MDTNINPEGFVPSESFDNYQSFSSNSPAWQDSTPHFRGQGHYSAPYPTSNPRMRQRGDFSQRGRHTHHRRGGGGGGRRPQNRNLNYDQQNEQSLDNNEYGTITMNNPSNRNFNTLFRPSMLQDPWVNMKPQKVPGNGTSLVSDSTTQ